MKVRNNLNVGQQLVSSNDSQVRAILNAIKKDRAGCVITWSYLRSEVQLVASQGSITFPILVNDSPAANNNERRLNISDEFQVVSWGVFLYKKLTAQSIETTILNTYPNPTTFAKSGEAGALQALYNGFLTATIDRKQIIPAFDAFNFYKVPDAQLGLVSAAIAGPVTYPVPNSAYLSNEWGFCEAIPTFRLSGAVVNQIQLVPPAAQDMTGTASVNYAVLFMRGFLIQNGAQFKGKLPVYNINE
jgi:hypothetical protein